MESDKEKCRSGKSADADVREKLVCARRHQRDITGQTRKHLHYSAQPMGKQPLPTTNWERGKI